MNAAKLCVGLLSVACVFASACGDDGDDDSTTAGKGGSSGKGGKGGQAGANASGKGGVAGKAGKGTGGTSGKGGTAGKSAGGTSGEGGDAGAGAESGVGATGGAGGEAGASTSCGSPIMVPTGSAAAPDPAGQWSGNGDADDDAGSLDGDTNAGVTYAAGVAGQAFVLNGSTGYVSLPDGPIEADDRSFSVAAWVKIPAAAAATDQKIYYSGTNAGEFQLSRDASGKAYFGVDLVGNTWAIATSPCPLPTGKWALVVGVRRDKTAELWVDGALWASAAVPDEDLLTSESTTSAIGAAVSGGAPGALFQGSVDEVRLFDAALTGNQIAKLYADENP